MKPSRFVNLLVVFLFVVVSFAIPGAASADQSWQQTTRYITGNGQYTDGYSQCGTFSITFNPAGGPVSGSLQSLCPLYGNSGKVGEETIQVTLTGTFDGGDGGVVRGTVATGEVTDTYTINTDQCSNCRPGTRSMVGAPWEGNLRADGTGDGWFVKQDFSWSVTYSAQDFQAGLASSMPTKASVPTKTPIPTLASFPTETPTEVDGMTDLLEGPSSVVVKSWPELIAAIADITNQEDAIIARDEKGVYYAIDNQGIQKALPVELQSVLQMNNEFGLLQNAQILWTSPAVQAFVAAKGDNAMDAITGKGNYQYYTIPEWLKQRQYMKESTQCGNGDCLSHTTIWMPDFSGYFPQQALASSEHSSVRGTINGGGDFIYAPLPGNGVELASLSFVPQGGLQNAGDPPYLGVKVLDSTDRAYVKMVQRGSPADEAGLAVDDQIVSVSGTSLDDSKNTLAVLIDQHSGGDQVELGVIRVGETGVTPITVTLASMLSSRVIVTPSAEITVSDNTEFVVDIGFNGVTGVLVLADTAHVREPVTGSEVDVPAGMAVIVLTGYEIGDPIPFATSDINAWWQSPEPAATVQPQPTAEPDTPSPTTLFLMGLVTLCLCLFLSVVVVVGIIIVIRKMRRPVNPPYPPG